MKVLANNTIAQQNYATSPQSAPSKEKAKSDSLVDKIVDKTYLSANYAASGLSGAAAGVGAWATEGVPQAFKATGSAVKNILKTEKFGPTLKLAAAAGSVVAGVVGGVLAAPISLVCGIWQGAGEVNNSIPRQFTVSQATQEAFSEVKEGLRDTGSSIVEDMQELGAYKLKPGERPIDVPLIRAAKTVVMGTLAAVVGGAVGLATAATSMVTEAGKGIAEAFTDDRLNIGEKVYSSVTSVIGAAAHGVSYGVRSGFSTLGQGIASTWDKDSVTDGAKKIFNEAKNSFAASVAPQKTLLEERPASDA